MAVKYKIIEESFEDSFELIAIHSNLEDYALAYHLNEKVNLRLARGSKDLELDTVAFPVFEWEDKVDGQCWQLLCNYKKHEIREDAVGLFTESKTSRTYYLVEERRDIDFFLKITPGNPKIVKEMVKTLMTVPKLTMAYVVDSQTIKAKQNLIFY
ncbi:MAG: IPExxxVDY family protein [Bacteroidota bacterium]